MDNLTASRIAGGNTAYKRVARDFYPTPPEATVALMDFLDLPKGTKIWEPACGQGHMVKVMEQMGYAVIGTDIQFGDDFLKALLMNGLSPTRRFPSQSSLSRAALSMAYHLRCYLNHNTGMRRNAIRCLICNSLRRFCR